MNETMHDMYRWHFENCLKLDIEFLRKHPDYTWQRQSEIFFMRYVI